MKTRSKVYIAMTLALILGISAWSIFLYAASQRQKAFDRLEVANSKLRIRVTAYHEFVPYSLPGARYVFQSAGADSDDWQEIMIFNADQAEPIPRDHVRFVDDRIAYAFIGNYYMVTTNSGRDWFIWQSEKYLPDEQESLRLNISATIEQVQMLPDGSGKMVLIPYFKQQARGPELSTVDFGKHWLIK